MSAFALLLNPFYILPILCTLIEKRSVLTGFFRLEVNVFVKLKNGLYNVLSASSFVNFVLKTLVNF